MVPIKIAVPNKGRLSESTLDLFRKAGIKVENTHDRRLFATAMDGAFQLLFVRAGDIPEFVADGVADIGVTGLDIIEETGKGVERLMDLKFGACRLVLAAPDESPVKTAVDLPENARVATSFPNLTRRFFERRGRKVRIVEVSGATEATPHIGVADYITDLTSTGSTLLMNGLREVESILQSTAWVVGNPEAVHHAQKGPRIRELLFAFESVVAARGKRYLMANVPRHVLDEVRRILPGLTGPTIMEISGHPDIVAAHAVVSESQLFETVNRLKAVGASGILVLPIERLVP
ncbi:MAG TPA: ATP phosphoribosyltransferase [Candidatus Thermoplasmatota archaeon]|nr:ATP phosphoribosyltransferase [Candidatus Thermoplasmatota archaeon]